MAVNHPTQKVIFVFLFGMALHGDVLCAAPPVDAVLVERENVVEVETGGGPWRAGKKDDELKFHELVRTGELSRAVIQFADSSRLRMDELTKVELRPPEQTAAKPVLDISAGAAYLFSRDKPKEFEIRTPSANGALRGTELVIRVSERKTQMTVLDGEVEMSNAQGRVFLHSGEEGEAILGQAPHKTAVIDARNIIQWCLYYPGVLDPASLHFTNGEQHELDASFAAYRSGDLLAALEKFPRNAPTSADGRVYHAAVLLAVGQVEKARRALEAVSAAHADRQALEEMIAAVRLTDWNGARPSTSSGWVAESYYLQAHGKLEDALQAAQKATELSPEFGYAWERVAELKFSFGRTEQALSALKRALTLAPRNAEAHSLKGFLESAENKIGTARESFNTAIGIDGALGNAWLGRGLTYIRQGQSGVGRNDLQTAAVLEPNRSLLRSYLGKAFSQDGFANKARLELGRAEGLDPNDPTPWLYSAIEAKQENRYNDAVGDLEKSLALNDNRRIYRSQFLLDQDRSVRGTNLAAIYLNDGMVEQSVREAVQAVNDDYSSASAHLFLSNSYDALRDPNRVELRYETAWFNELLLSNLLSPVGGGPLSQFVSQQEYSKLFEKDGLGISSTSDYFSNGEFHETASQFGTVGNLSYALDAEYLYERGYRPNDADSLLETYATFKLQLSPADTILLKLSGEDQRTGDIFKSYDPRGSVLTLADRTQHFHEQQDPGLALVGLHHEWAPGIRTIVLLGRLANEQTLNAQATNQGIVSRNISALVPPNELAARSPSFSEKAADLNPFLGRGQVTDFNLLPFDFGYEPKFEIYSAELQQIAEIGPMTFVAGARYQKGRFDTRDQLLGVGPNFSAVSSLFNTPAGSEADTVDFQRINLYFYDTWRIAPWLSVTGGVTWDKLTYPDNFRSPPVNDRADQLNKVSPKVGFILQPTPTLTVRGAYAEAISGASFDESVRLEPTQVAGFDQAYRTLISESFPGIGSVAGATYDVYGLSLEKKFPTRTYVGVEYDLFKQHLDRDLGVFDFIEDPRNLAYAAVLPSSLSESIAYREQVWTASINQLVGRDWSLGARFQYTRSSLREALPDLSLVNPAGAFTHETSSLYETSLFALYNHPSGFFARLEANWYKQNNVGYGVTSTENPGVGADFWQLNASAGYRFYKNQCELSLGVLNIGGRDYRLEPLTPYSEMPRERTLVVHCKFDF